MLTDFPNLLIQSLRISLGSLSLSCWPRDRSMPAFVTPLRSSGALLNAAPIWATAPASPSRTVKVIQALLSRAYQPLARLVQLTGLPFKQPQLFSGIRCACCHACAVSCFARLLSSRDGSKSSPKALESGMSSAAEQHSNHELCPLHALAPKLAETHYRAVVLRVGPGGPTTLKLRSDICEGSFKP